MEPMNHIFPRYTAFDPKVPVWCVTADTPGCIHRFFDTSPISPSGRYLAVFQLPFEDRQPEPGDSGHVRVVDLQTGENRVVGETCGWEPQMGANVNWGGSDQELFFNDVDTSTWQPFAWKVDPLSGKREKMEGTVYHASPDGRWLISANMTTMRRTQPGYGVCIPLDHVRRNLVPAQDDGFLLTDTTTGKTRLLASIADILAKTDPPVDVGDASQYGIYGFHSKFNPQGDRLMLSLRWFPKTPEPRWNMFAVDRLSVRFAWVTMTLDGEEMRCAVGPDQWVKGGHHATWFPDGKRISMNLNIDRNGLRLVEVANNASRNARVGAPDGPCGRKTPAHRHLHPGSHSLRRRYGALALDRPADRGRIRSRSPQHTATLRGYGHARRPPSGMGSDMALRHFQRLRRRYPAGFCCRHERAAWIIIGYW